MRLASVQAIIKALNDAGVRYLVAGGLAVNVYGYARFTKDIDLVLELAPVNIHEAFTALAALGYRPIVPLTADQFADATLRAALVREKGMQVLQLYSDQNRDTSVDIFAEVPFSFDEEFERATIRDLAGAGPVRFVSIRTLIRMKEAAGRPTDRIDVEHLRMRLEDDEHSA
ncbi:MAG: nucleotidyl transferase AbiEii/AbiGii toxin family protein [Longimicrobiales bacterium]